MGSTVVHDIIIIGAGPAGMTAAIYAARADKDVVIIEKEAYGGNIARSPRVENIPGFTKISGADFSDKMYDQISSFDNIEFVFGEAVKIDQDYNLVSVELDDGSIVVGKTLIVATGTKHRELKADTKDVYYCVTCDGPFFKGRDVVVIGSGNTGATYALELCRYCNKVYLTDIMPNMLCEKALQERIEKKANIVWLPSRVLKAVENNENNELSSVLFNDIQSNIETKIDVSAIFAAIGMDPVKLVLDNVDINEKGYIVADESCKTNVKNIFVAGDIRTKNVRQVTTAVSDGTNAAIAAMKYLDTLL